MSKLTTVNGHRQHAICQTAVNSYAMTTTLVNKHRRSRHWTMYAYGGIFTGYPMNRSYTSFWGQSSKTHCIKSVQIVRIVVTSDTAAGTQ